MKEDMDVIKAREQVEQMKEGEKMIHNKLLHALMFERICFPLCLLSVVTILFFQFFV